MSMKFGVESASIGSEVAEAGELSSAERNPSPVVAKTVRAGASATARRTRPRVAPVSRAPRATVTADETLSPSAALSPISQRRHACEADLGWAAGVMDGEGCIHIARQTYGETGRRPTYRLRLHISQNSEFLLREFAWAVGVAGRLYSPKPTRKQNRVCHSLVYDGIRAFVVLERLRQHLRRKKPEAELAAEFRAQCDIHRHPGPKGCPESIWELREWYYERMSGLKRS